MRWNLEMFKAVLVGTGVIWLKGLLKRSSQESNCSCDQKMTSLGNGVRKNFNFCNFLSQRAQNRFGVRRQDTLVFRAKGYKLFLFPMGWIWRYNLDKFLNFSEQLQVFRQKLHWLLLFIWTQCRVVHRYEKRKFLVWRVFLKCWLTFFVMNENCFAFLERNSVYRATSLKSMFGIHLEKLLKVPTNFKIALFRIIAFDLLTSFISVEW